MRKRDKTVGNRTFRKELGNETRNTNSLILGCSRRRPIRRPVRAMWKYEEKMLKLKRVRVRDVH